MPFKISANVVRQPIAIEAQNVEAVRDTAVCVVTTSTVPTLTRVVDGFVKAKERRSPIAYPTELRDSVRMAKYPGIAFVPV